MQHKKFEKNFLKNHYSTCHIDSIFKKAPTEIQNSGFQLAPTIFLQQNRLSLNALVP